ncbi:MAG TPA: twin-arginine translocase TatA/TatE family subunit [Acidobacteriaceae bacterium]|jgi:sec-independent protein translocase protein TatB|nr:twin-arginine translocase TatA/TatE family subunit [Acidobacteriaceae bacterium]
MPGFGDSAFIILLALLLFGPKKLPVLARQLGKLMGDFRRASNEFRTQMEEELRISEQAERQKQISTLEASAPPSPSIDVTSAEEAHTPPEPPAFATPDYPDALAESVGENSIARPADAAPIPAEPTPADVPVPESAQAPLPIARSGDLSMMPPSTGLPVPSTSSSRTSTTHETELETETLHG